MKPRLESLQNMLIKLGMSPERLRVSYVSAAEGLIFADIMKEMRKQMDDLGPEKIKAENAKLRPVIENMLARKGLLRHPEITVSPRVR
jgi:hypothetical protein